MSIGSIVKACCKFCNIHSKTIFLGSLFVVFLFFILYSFILSNPIDGFESKKPKNPIKSLEGDETKEEKGKKEEETV